MMSVVGLSASNPDTKKGILRITESKFALLRYTEYQKTLYAMQLEHGGLPTSPPCLMITMFHGENFILPSVHTTYLRVCSAASGRSS
jgi:hypothetical protein